MFSKAIDKLTVILIVVIFAVGFRELVVTDTATAAAFGELMGMLPFSQELAQPIAKILQCQYQIPIISHYNVLTSLMILIIMACIQPLCMAVLSAIFLRIPGGLTDWYDRERYMDSLGYRAKELMLTVVTAPLLAVGAALLGQWLLSWLSAQLGTLGGFLTSIGIVAAGIGLSTLPLLFGGVGLGAALLWRLGVTLLPKLLEVFVTDALCIAVYLAVLGGVRSQIFLTVGALVLWLGIYLFGIRLIMSSIAGRNL